MHYQPGKLVGFLFFRTLFCNQLFLHFNTGYKNGGFFVTGPPGRFVTWLYAGAAKLLAW